MYSSTLLKINNPTDTEQETKKETSLSQTIYIGKREKDFPSNTKMKNQLTTFYWSTRAYFAPLPLEQS
jgi:hypothetical protein